MPYRTEVMMRIVHGLLAGLIVLGAVLLGAAPAYAHLALVSSDPTDGATLEAAPDTVRLTFSDEVDARLTKVALTVDGRPVELSDDAVRIERTKVTVRLPDPADPDSAMAEPGRKRGELGGRTHYRLVYRVVGDDGHRVDGEIRFTADNGRVAAARSAAEKRDEAGSDGSGGDGKERAVTKSWVWLLVGLGAVVLLGALAYVLVAGRQRGEDSGGNHDAIG